MRSHWQFHVGVYLLLVAACSAGQAGGSRRGDVAGNRAFVELVRNAGFETDGASLPEFWTRDSRADGKGTAGRDPQRAHSGEASLRLDPNEANGGQFLLAISQIIPAGEYAGRDVEFSAYVSAEGGSIAGLGLLSLIPGRRPETTFTPPGTSAEWVYRSASFKVPDHPQVQLVVFCLTDRTVGSAWFDDVSVKAFVDEPQTGLAAVAAAAREELELAAGSITLRASVEVDAGAVVRDVPATLFGANVDWRWDATSLWQPDGERVDPEALRLSREMGLTLIRYPGGIASDYYHWRDGIGPYDDRPIVRHEPDKPAESRPHFGTDEALAFADDIGAELLITVNAGTGTAQEAADWVRYVNRDGLRVRFWEVGNELYFAGGSGISQAVTVDPVTYAARVEEFATAMKAADARIQIGVIGGLNEGGYQQISYPEWNETIFERVPQFIDFLSIHNAYAPVLTGDEAGRDPRVVYRAMLGRPRAIAANLRRQAEQIERYFPDPARRPFIAITEWGPIFQFFHAGRYVDHPKTLGSALFVASTMKALLESPQSQIAAFWMLNDYSPLGWIGSLNSDFPPAPEWAPTARYFTFQMFSRYFGERVVESRAIGPMFNTEKVGWSDAQDDVPYLDVIASLSADGNTLYLMAINKHFEATIEATIEISGFEPLPGGTAWLLSGTGIDANTGTKVIAVPWIEWGEQHEDARDRRFNRGGPDEVTLRSVEVDGLGLEFSYSFPEHSVTTLVMTRR